MTATVWSQEGCSRCLMAKRKLEAEGHSIIEKDIQALIDGFDKDVDAMAQLALQNQELPVVKVDENMIYADELIGV